MTRDAVGSGESHDDRPDATAPEQAEPTVTLEYADPGQDLETAQHEADEAATYSGLDVFEPDEPAEGPADQGHDLAAAGPDPTPRAAPKRGDRDQQEATDEAEALVPDEDEARAAAASGFQFIVHRAGAAVVGDTVEVAEPRQPADQTRDDTGDTADDNGTQVRTAEASRAPVERAEEPEAAADSAQPPRPPDDTSPPEAGSGDEGEPEEASDAGAETGIPEGDLYTVAQVAQVVGLSYSGVTEVVRRNDSLLSFHNAPEDTGQRYASFPAPYINALKDFQQQNGINAFTKAADQFAQTVEGQSLAQGLRAEHEDRIREYEKAQDGYLTPSQAGELMNVSLAYLIQHGLVTNIPSDDPQTGRIETFVIPRGVSAETVRQTMEWTHTAFTNPVEVPETVYAPSSDVEKELGCSRRAVLQMANNGYIPNWRFEAESGRSNRRYPPDYVAALGEHLRTHTKQDLIEAAEDFARAHPHDHTAIRGQFELGLDRLAKQGEGYIPREQLANYLHLPQGQFWRTFGPKPDTRGYPVQYVRDRIRWSGANIADRERATVDARGRTRWQVMTPGIKGQILGEVEGGNVPTVVARSHGIPPRTVLGWVEAGRRATEAERPRQPEATTERLARTLESRREQQERDVAEASKGMGADSARQIVVDSRPAAKQFTKWVADHEQAIMRVAASRDDIDQRQIAAQIALARLVSEQYRIFPSDMLTFAKIFDDLKPLVQVIPASANENPDNRPVLSARQIAALRFAADLAHKGRMSYFPEAGV